MDADYCRQVAVISQGWRLAEPHRGIPVEDLSRKYRRWSVYFFLSSVMMFLFFALSPPVGLLGFSIASYFAYFHFKHIRNTVHESQALWNLGLFFYALDLGGIIMILLLLILR